MPLVLFDIDLTLVHAGGAGRIAIDAAFSRLFGIGAASDGIRFDGRTDHAIFGELIALHGIGGSDPAAVYGRAVDAYLRELDAALASRPGRVLPGVPPLLDALAERRVPFGLATGNIRAGAERKLRHFGLWERFAAGGFGDNSSVRAEVVREAIRAVAPAAWPPGPVDVVVVGDTPLDTEAAHAAGARSLGVGTGAWTAAQLRANGADAAVDDLGDLESVLAVLLG